MGFLKIALTTFLSLPNTLHQTNALSPSLTAEESLCDVGCMQRDTEGEEEYGWIGVV